MTDPGAIVAVVIISVIIGAFIVLVATHLRQR
jgi:hypothetical protein